MKYKLIKIEGDILYLRKCGSQSIVKPEIAFVKDFKSAAGEEPQVGKIYDLDPPLNYKKIYNAYY